MSGTDKLDFIFNPRSVAIVGVSATEGIINMGRLYLESLLSAGFAGPIYPINPKGGEVRGLKIYANVKDVPGPLDYAICCIPAHLTPQLVKDCVAKGVKVILLFNSGFSETGTEEGKRLEAEVYQIAAQGGIRLIGPNCMGVYYPKNGLSFTNDFSKESGRVGYICQSGGNAIYLVRLASQRGIRFSKVVSYGNACDVNESDLLEYFIADSETDIILLYIEGVKDGRRFKQLLQKAAAAKPVIVLKGGYTEPGARAASSHTGALAGSTQVFNSLVQQAGAIPVHSLEEMTDLLVTFLHLPVPRGRRIGTLGIGGGATVVATDVYAAAGLVLPPFPKEFQQKLMGFVPTVAGLSLNNPVDLSGEHFNMALYNVGKTLADYDGIDVLVFHLPLSIVPMLFAYPEKMVFTFIDAAIRIHREATKPIAAVIHNLPNGEVWQEAYNCQRKCHQAGIPAYFSMESAAKAIGQYISYHECRARRAEAI